MCENELRSPDVDEHVAAHGLGGEIAHGGERLIDERRSDAEIERSPEHGSRVEERARRRREQEKTCANDVANAIGQAPRHARRVASIAREPQHLHDEERIPLRRGVERVRVADSLCRGPARYLLTPEATEREVATFTSDLRQRVARFRREARLHVTVGGDDDDSRRMQVSGDEMEQGQRADVRHVHIVEKDDERPVSRREREKGRDGLEEAESILRRVGRGLRRLARLELGQEMRERSDPCALRVACTRGERSERTHRLDPRPVRWSPARLPRTPPRDLSATRTRLAREVVGQARLADPRLADEEDERSLATLGRAERGVELRKLSITPEQRLWPGC